MLFQTLDDKTECVSYYFDNNFTKEYDTRMTHSWTAPVYLQGKSIEYAYLYAQQGLKESCPDFLKQELDECLSLLTAYSRSMLEAKLDLTQHCFYDLVPQHFLKRFCEIKNRISRHVFETTERPADYDFLKGLHEVCQEISHRQLSLDFREVLKDTTGSAFSNKLKNVRAAAPYVRYNIFGSRTGRLTTMPNSFPILNLNKEFRAAIKPVNDRFIELDYNAFELRVLLFLMGKEQPMVDIHQWNLQNVYRGIGTRDEAKTRIFSWLYNLESNDHLSERAYNRQEIIEKYWDGTKITNPFGRTIEADRFHALSYLIQSTAVDIVLRQMVKLHHILRGRKSYIAFTIHDSVVIDLAEEDIDLVIDLRDQFSNFQNTKFLTNVSVGKDFGNMK